MFSFCLKFATLGLLLIFKVNAQTKIPQTALKPVCVCLSSFCRKALQLLTSTYAWHTKDRIRQLHTYLLRSNAKAFSSVMLALKRQDKNVDAKT